MSSAFEDMSLSERVNFCGQINSTNERLSCFDALVVGTSKSDVSKESKKTVIPVIVETNKVPLAQKKEVDDFAKEHLKIADEDKGLESITSTVTKLKKLLRGQWVIDLDNGQQWQQKDSANIKLKKGNIVRIQKGAMGAIYLFKEGSHRSIRVKRLK